MRAVVLLPFLLSACVSSPQGAREGVVLFSGKAQAIRQAAYVARYCNADARIVEGELAIQLELRASSPRRARQCLVDWYFRNGGHQTGLAVNARALVGL